MNARVADGGTAAVWNRARRIARGLASLRANGTPLVLLFDYDGTLAPLTSHPADAAIPPSTRVALERLAATPRISLGVVSGRSLQDVEAQLAGRSSDRVLPLRVKYLVGTNGVELKLRGRRYLAPGAPQARRRVARVDSALQRAASRFPGAWVEKKPFGATLHWREVERSRWPALRASLDELTRTFGDGITFAEGQRALEATAALGWDKGTAVRRIARTAGHAGLLYAGDAPADRRAFHAASALGGWTVGVGRDVPAGLSLRLPDAWALGAFLGHVADLMRGPKT